MKRLPIKWACALAAAILASPAGAQAQGFPSKPITIVVPLAAGGAVDGMVRMLIEPMRASLGQPILVENMGGAGGTIGITRVARAAPDGYTISIGTWGTHVANNAIYSPPYDIVRDFEPVALLPNVPYWIVGKKDLPPNNLKDLVAWLKVNKASAGTVGAGGGATVCSRYFQRETGTDYQLVPYRGGAPALQDLVSGQIDLMCDLAANSLPQVKNGNIKAYAVMSKTRWSGAPDVPTAEKRACRWRSSPGMARGRPKAPRRTWSRNSTPPSWPRWPIRPRHSGSPASGCNRRRRSIAHRRRSDRTSRPRPTSGGPSSRRRELRRSRSSIVRR